MHSNHLAIYLITIAMLLICLSRPQSHLIMIIHDACSSLSPQPDHCPHGVALTPWSCSHYLVHGPGATYRIMELLVKEV